MKNKEKLKINISGKEQNKGEIVYNNLIDNLNLSEVEQLEYLKSRVAYLELELQNKMMTIILCVISLIGIGLGLYLMVLDIYFLGVIFVVTTFSLVVIRFYLMYHNTVKTTKNIEFDKIENLRKLLNTTLK
ncbi:MAG: hypothetical protein ACK5HP_02580 [Bacilli bacterium]